MAAVNGCHSEYSNNSHVAATMVHHGAGRHHAEKQVVIQKSSARAMQHYTVAALLNCINTYLPHAWVVCSHVFTQVLQQFVVSSYCLAAVAVRERCPEQTTGSQQLVTGYLKQ